MVVVADTTHEDILFAPPSMVGWWLMMVMVMGVVMVMVMMSGRAPDAMMPKVSRDPKVSDRGRRRAQSRGNRHEANSLHSLAPRLYVFFQCRLWGKKRWFWGVGGQGRERKTRKQKQMSVGYWTVVPVLHEGAFSLLLLLLFLECTYMYAMTCTSYRTVYGASSVMGAPTCNTSRAKKTQRVLECHNQPEVSFHSVCIRLDRDRTELNN